MKTRLEEVNDLLKDAKKNILSFCTDFDDHEAMTDWLEEYVNARIEKAMIEKGYVHG